MAKVYADIEHQIEAQELVKFNELAKHLGKELQETIEICMFEKRDELLDQFINNVPDKKRRKNKKQKE